MALFPTRKPGKDAQDTGFILRLVPFMLAVAGLLLYTSISSSPVHSIQRELTALRSEVGKLHWSHTMNTSTSNSTIPWQFTASCGDMEEHVKMREGLLDPRAMLKHLVKQQGHAWLQIGSNTMDSKNNNDPMKKLLDSIPTWDKVFVEPIPQLYAKLQESVKRWPNATAVNVALSPDRSITETKAQMWCYGAAFDSQRLGKDLPSWANQICSFNASHIGRHFKGQHGVPIEVTSVSLEELLKRSGIDSAKLQILMIDTEGFDYAVLQQIPFEQIRPAFVLWEHKHLYANRKRAEALMRSHCYAVKVLDKENTVAMAMFQ